MSVACEMIEYLVNEEAGKSRRWSSARMQRDMAYPFFEPFIESDLALPELHR